MSNCQHGVVIPLTTSSQIETTGLFCRVQALWRSSACMSTHISSSERLRSPCSSLRACCSWFAVLLVLVSLVTPALGANHLLYDGGVRTGNDTTVTSTTWSPQIGAGYAVGSAGLVLANQVNPCSPAAIPSIILSHYYVHAIVILRTCGRSNCTHCSGIWLVDGRRRARKREYHSTA